MHGIFPLHVQNNTHNLDLNMSLLLSNGTLFLVQNYSLHIYGKQDTIEETLFNIKMQL